jgi:hypothetical protein
MIDWAKIMPPDTAPSDKRRAEGVSDSGQAEETEKDSKPGELARGGGAAKPLRADKDRISREFSGTSCGRAVGHGLVETQEGKRH